MVFVAKLTKAADVGRQSQPVPAWSSLTRRSRHAHMVFFMIHDSPSLRAHWAEPSGERGCARCSRRASPTCEPVDSHCTLRSKQPHRMCTLRRGSGSIICSPLHKNWLTPTHFPKILLSIVVSVTDSHAMCFPKANLIRSVRNRKVHSQFTAEMQHFCEWGSTPWTLLRDQGLCKGVARRHKCTDAIHPSITT